MSTLKLKIYSKEFNVTKSFGVTHFIIRALLLIPILFLAVFLLRDFNRLLFPILIVASLYLFMFISDRYLRRLYPDWPKTSNTSGEIHFLEKEIQLHSNSDVKNFVISDFREMIFFHDHYSGYTASARDVQRNGNALLHVIDVEDRVFNVKFNIRTEEQYKHFKSILSTYQEQVYSFEEKTPNDVQFILKPDLSGRRNYR